MKISEINPREKRGVLWGHCQNILNDPRRCPFHVPIKKWSFNFHFTCITASHDQFIYLIHNYVINVKQNNYTLPSLF